jgi:hypothetical protein
MRIADFRRRLAARLSLVLVVIVPFGCSAADAWQRRLNFFAADPKSP